MKMAELHRDAASGRPRVAEVPESGKTVQFNVEGAAVSDRMAPAEDSTAALEKAREALSRMAGKQDEASAGEKARSGCPNTFAVWAYRR
jgi:hypothetical protein